MNIGRPDSYDSKRTGSFTSKCVFLFLKVEIYLCKLFSSTFV